jgi:hypothetical protein
VLATSSPAAVVSVAVRGAGERDVYAPLMD